MVAPPPAAAAGTVVPTVVVTTDMNPSAITETVAVTVTVTGASGTPTGNVTVKDGMATIGMGALSNGTFTLGTVPFLVAADHMLTAEYAGDTTYAAATSTPMAQTVVATVSRKTWSNAAGGNWSVASNWEEGAAPVDGDTVVFEATSAAANNDIDGLDLAHFSFASGGWVTGKSVTLSGSIHTLEGVPDVNLPISLNSGAHTLDGGASIGGVLSGAGGLNKTGPQTVFLKAVNTFTGANTVEGGVLESQDDNALGATSAGTTVKPGGTVRLVDSTAEPFTLEGDGFTGQPGALHVFTGTASGAVALTGSRVSIGGSGTVSGVISGSSSSLRLNGPNVGLAAANTFNGLEVASGTGVAGVAGALGSGSATVGPAATLAFTGPGTGTRTFSNPITTGAGSFVSVSGGGTIGLTGAMTLNGDTTLQVDATLNVASVISGAGTLTKTGAGTLLFTGGSPNTSTGLFTVSQGDAWGAKSNGVVSVPSGVTVNADDVFAVVADGQIGDAAPVTVAASGTLDFFGSDDTIGSLTSSGDVLLGFFDSSGLYLSQLQTGTLTLNSGSELFMLMTTVGADKITAGSVTLGGTLVLDGTLPRGTTTTIIDNTGTNPVSGTFSGLGEGATVALVDATATISYKGGDGNDVTLTVPQARSGYWMVDQRGKVYPFGDAKHYGEPSAILNAGGGLVKAVDIEPASDYNGYWVLTDRGDVYAYGSATQLGQPLGQLQSGELATSLSNDGFDNYWVFTNKGRVFDYGDAGHFKDMSGVALNGPVLGSVSTASGFGYFMVASDGGIFAFGDAVFRGSMGGKPLNGPVVGLAPDPDNDGYWLVATDGGIFAFNATFKGSMGGKPLNKPMIGMVPYGDGYLMVASDGGIFNFSTKAFKGSLGGQAIPYPIVAVAPLNEV